MISNLAISPIQKRRYGHTLYARLTTQRRPICRKHEVISITAAALLALSGTAVAEPRPDGATRNIVIVHGAFVDGSGWRAVHDILEKDGYRVSIVQEPLQLGLADDVAATNCVLDLQDGPCRPCRSQLWRFGRNNCRRRSESQPACLCRGAPARRRGDCWTAPREIPGPEHRRPARGRGLPAA